MRRISRRQPKPGGQSAERGNVMSKKSIKYTVLLVLIACTLLFTGCSLFSCYIPPDEPDPDNGIETQFITSTNFFGVIIDGLTPGFVLPQDGYLVLPDTIDDRPVVAIGPQAFMNRSGITQVTIPATVTSIGDLAFYMACELKTVTFESGSSLRTIGSNAFAFSGITAITLPNTVTSIGQAAFERTQITAFTLPANVTGILRFTFRSSNLQTVDLAVGSRLVSIDEEAFAGTAITELYIPATVESISQTAFYNAGVVQFTVDQRNRIYASDNGSLFSRDMTRLFRFGGNNHNNGTAFRLPNATTDIYNFAFANSNVTKVYLNNVERIHDHAFAGSSLTSLDYGNNRLNFIGLGIVDNTPFLRDLPAINGFRVLFTTIISYVGSETVITAEMFNALPATVTVIGDGAFRHRGLVSVDIPERITWIGDLAFANNNLTAVSVHRLMRHIGQGAFSNNNLSAVVFYGLSPPWGGIGAGAFSNNASDMQILVPRGSEEAYRTHWSLVQFADIISTLYVTINLVSEGELIASITMPFFGVIDSLPTPVRYGFVFEDWFAGDGLFIRNGHVNTLRNGATLYAGWRAV